MTKLAKKVKRKPYMSPEGQSRRNKSRAIKTLVIVARESFSFRRK